MEVMNMMIYSPITLAIPAIPLIVCLLVMVASIAGAVEIYENQNRGR